jgi:hypothetical protein
MGCCTFTASSARHLSPVQLASIHQCPTGCIFNLENNSDIETVPDASEFLRNTLNLRDDVSVVVYCV